MSIKNVVNKMKLNKIETFLPLRGRGRPTVALLAILVVADPAPDGVILPPRDAAPDTTPPEAAHPTAQLAARMLGQLVRRGRVVRMLLPPLAAPPPARSPPRINFAAFTDPKGFSGPS